MLTMCTPQGFLRYVKIRALGAAVLRSNLCHLFRAGLMIQNVAQLVLRKFRSIIVYVARWLLVSVAIDCCCVHKFNVLEIHHVLFLSVGLTFQCMSVSSFSCRFVNRSGLSQPLLFSRIAVIIPHKFSTLREAHQLDSGGKWERTCLCMSVTVDTSSADMRCRGSQQRVCFHSQSIIEQIQ